MKNKKGAVLSKFDWNVASISPQLIMQEALIDRLVDYFQSKSPFLSKLIILEGIKSKTPLPSISTNATLQGKLDCGFTPSGTTTWGERELEVKPVYTAEIYCNENLVGKWTEMLLKAGLNGQNDELVKESLITAMHVWNFTNKVWRSAWKGDYQNQHGTATGVPELQLFEGFLNLINADLNSIHVNAVAITPANAHMVIENFASVIPASALNEGVTYEIYTSRANAVKVLHNIWKHKDYSALVTGADLSSETIEFNLPISGFKLVSDKYLEDTDLIAVPFDNAFLGTDQEGDMEYVRADYSERTDDLQVVVQARVGVQTNKPENWVIMSSNIPQGATTNPIDLNLGANYCLPICS